MINIAGGLIAIGLGSVLVKMAYDQATQAFGQVEAMKAEGKIKKADWTVVKGEVVELGLNVDYPEVLKSWPKREGFETDEQFKAAIAEANDQILYANQVRNVYGDVLIRYRFTDHDGAEVVSRNIGTLPNRERDRELAKSLKVGQSVKVYYPKDDSTRALLRKTEDAAFNSYFNRLLGPAMGQFASGVIICALGVGSLIFG